MPICASGSRRKLSTGPPIDLIITHPANWPDEAVNKTYRAATAAFSTRVFPMLRNVSFVSEPEACAHYTLRAAQRADHGRLRRGDCFIVVDAGGGTVDLASFQITDIDPSKNRFKMESVGKITGDRCGSTYVDLSFNELLKRRLDPEVHRDLVDMDRFGEGGHYILKSSAARHTPELHIHQARLQGRGDRAGGDFRAARPEDHPGWQTNRG